MHKHHWSPPKLTQTPRRIKSHRNGLRQNYNKPPIEQPESPELLLDTTKGRHNANYSDDKTSGTEVPITAF
ncbi:hypothetical protein Q1695_013898 [Nippostrongylus brasiliensis]|nr:hypothetical protein Q1695_013898 [Nippostrongylus brasiliensis]